MILFKYILSILFVFAGAAKIFSAKPIQEQFEEFGLPLKLMIGIGVLEILGAIGLQFNDWAIYAAIGLLLLMIGAVGNHLKVKHPISKIIPSFLLLLSLASFLYFSLK